MGRSKKEVFSFLKDRVWDRVKRWNERDFSMASREVLIKAVLQAIPTYVMSYFRLPTTLLQDIEVLVRRFGGEEEQNIACIGFPGGYYVKPKEAEA